jgi:hypothetical protein
MSRVGGIEPEAGFKGERERYFLHFTCHTTKEIYPVDVLICGRGVGVLSELRFILLRKEQAVVDDERKIPSHLKMLRREKTGFWRGGQTRP